MSAFFDTNILVYAQQADGKADLARALFAGGGKISVQVLNEFVAVSRRKQQQDWDEIAEAISDVLAVVDPPLALTLDLHRAARTLAEHHRLSFYDALIVAAALEGGFDTLYTEDMQHGCKFGRLVIVNPFIEAGL
ncbi:MAG: PIN domain-containing protein [Bradyrhizobium sp.]|uniref:PIN domain-containing protein n=1 Tax=Bradyrhizobium sp. TaxID=376 RepID=UPI0027318CA4|nr:PIN domain-containing protein [Bradyrhizobium sp.]MDP1867539.1 PIN domain-containing protein [Bradyrhizobium sp.]